jgi:phage repressor protein C with HTH and peptisase S24 domain
MGMHELGAFLRRVRVEHGLTQAEMARAVGVDRSYISRLERGDDGYKSIGEDVLIRLAAAYRSTPEYLRAVLYDRPLPDALVADPEMAREVPIVAQATARERGQRYGGFRAHPTEGWLWVGVSETRGRLLRGVRVTGSCMAPLIEPGDVVVIDETQNPRDGQIVVVERTDGDVLIKRLYRDNGRVRLQPDNTDAGEPITLDADDCRVEGVVLEIRRRVS